MRLTAVVILLFGVGACGVVSSLVTWRMVDEVNQKLPEGERFESRGWHLAKRLRLHGEYDRLYPGGHRRRQLRYLFVAMFALLVGAAVLLGLFS